MTQASVVHRIIIGYGSELRGDDAAGREAANLLARRCPDDTLVLSVHQLTPELAPLLAQAQVAVFLDACTEAAQVEITAIAPDGAGQSAGHFADPAALLQLAHAIYGRIPEAWMVAIPASNFRLGAPFSATTQAAIAGAVELVQQHMNIGVIAP